jgi:hypothetical protein
MTPVITNPNTPWLKSELPSIVPWPVAPLNRPVPPVTCQLPVPWSTPGLTGHATSSLVTVSVSPLAAVSVSVLVFASPLCRAPDAWRCLSR